MDGKRPTPQSLGFRQVALFGTRSQLATVGRKSVQGQDGDRITYIVFDNEDSRALFEASGAATYMWIESGSQQPLYVGKASFGMKKRAGEHENGFHGTAAERKKREDGHTKSGKRDVTPGFGHARRIRSMWNHPEGRRDLELWVRPADYVEIFGGQISLAAAEEERLIALFQPPWNREHKREETNAPDKHPNVA